MKDVQEVRKIIASLKVKREESYGIHKQLAAAEDRLAYLTASVFVAVNSGEEIAVYGVSAEIKTRARGLFMSTDEGQVVTITSHFAMSALTIYLSIGGQASFQVTRDEEERRTTIYHIRAFAKSDEAEAWAKDRRYGNTSR